MENDVNISTNGSTCHLKRALVLHTSPTGFAPPWSEGQKNNLLAWMYFLRNKVIFDVISNNNFECVDNINIHYVYNPNKNYFQKIKFTWQICLKARQLVLRSNYDYIFVNINSYNVIIPILLFRKTKNIKKILILGGEKLYKYLEENRIRIGHTPVWLAKYIIGSFDKVVAVSRKIKREIIELKLVDEGRVFHFPAMSPVQTVSNFEESADSRSLKELLSYSKGDFVVSYIGNLKAERGIFVLLESIKRLSKYPFLKLLVCSNGLGDVAAVKSRINELALKNVYLEENPVRLSEVFGLSNVFVLPMLTQTHVFEYPLTVLESLWYTVPVVCSDFESFRELINNGDNGLLFEAGSVEGLRESLCLLMSNQSLYSKIKGRSRESLHKLYPSHLSLEFMNFLEK